MTLWHFWVE